MDTSSTALDPRFTARQRQPGLDLLRALAIIVVVVYHGGIMGFALPGRVHRFGWVGVDLFFVLSGYLIGGQLLQPVAHRLPIQFRTFFARRALRILPAYLVVLAIYAFIPAWREYPDMSPLWKFVVSVQNIGLHGGTAFSHAWSLAVEDQFYLVLPLVLLLLTRARPPASFAFPLAIIIGGVLLRTFLAVQNPAPTGGVSFRGFQTWIYYPTWTRLDPLVFGVGLAALEKFRTRWWHGLTNCAIWLWFPGLLLIVYALNLGETRDLTVTACVCQFPLVAFGMACLLICAVSPRSPLACYPIPGAAFIASISYSAYLVQKLVIHGVSQFCAAHNLPLTSLPALLLVELGVYVAATILFLLIERPFLQLRHRFTGRQPHPGVASDAASQ